MTIQFNKITENITLREVNNILNIKYFTKLLDVKDLAFKQNK